MNLNYLVQAFALYICPFYSKHTSLCEKHIYFSISEKGSVSVLSEFQHLFPTKISSSLASWKRITYEDFVVAILIALVDVFWYD